MAKQYLVVAAAIATAFVLVSERPSWAGCERDTDCKGDRVCNAGVCVAAPQPAASCQKDSDCPGDAVCENNACVAPTSAPAPVTSSPAPTTTPAPVGTPAPAAPVTSPPPPTAAPPPVAAPAVPAAPGAPPPAPPGAPPVAPPAKVETTQQHRYLSLVVPDTDGLWELAGELDMNQVNQPLTIGVRAGGLFNFPGENEASLFDNFYALTVGARSGDKGFAVAGRLAAQVNITQVKFMEMSDTSVDFEAVAIADLAMGHFFAGAEYWFRGEMAALRVGGTW